MIRKCIINFNLHTKLHLIRYTILLYLIANLNVNETLLLLEYHTIKKSRGADDVQTLKSEIELTSLVCIEDLYRHEAKNIHQGGFN